MRSLRARLLAILTCVAVVGSGWVEAGAAELVLSADAHVNSAQPAVNSGTISNLDVGGGYSTYLQFSLSTLPSGTTAAQISKAVLRLYANRVTTAGTVSVAPVTALWGEYSITYANQPATGSSAGSISVSAADQFVTVDVTSLVQSWVTTPSTNFGVVLTSSAAVVQFDSKENDITSHAPALEVDLVNSGPQGAAGATGATGPAGPVGAAGSAGATGAQGPAGPQGATGAQGPMGVAGATGAMGATGPAGPVGATGATGAQGAAGAGVAYQGSYQSTTNYGLGDVVLWQGSSYISLTASNHGNTPSAVPAAWGLLTAQGATGATGATGAVGAQGLQGLPGNVGPNGPEGPAGPQGIAGTAGAQGIPGATGATGAQGPMGPQGVAGPVGLSFQGTYQAGTNYALADGVSYNGTGYVSLVANNHGNTPDQSPSDWALFAAAGTAGATGAAGPAGATGAQGPAGPVGATGATGAAGAVGPQGPAVANYVGSYQSGANYGLHDAVSWQGSTWISLAGSNAGNTPDQSAAWWALLAAQGPAGPTGAAGAQGAAGAAGATGATGAAGPQGPPVNFLGGWSTSQAYSVGGAVSYGGSSYIALQANSGREPDLSPQYWALLAAAGTAGATGAQGPQGLQGPAGYAGPAGATGATGAAGATGATGAQGAPVNFLGAYSSATTYKVGDAVSWQGSSYISLVAANRGSAPDQTPSAWGVLAAQGTAGPQGTAGATGAQGPQGVQGPAGPAGATGVAGAAGINFRGAWTSGTYYATNDAVTFGGSSYLAQMNNSSAEPDLYAQAWAVLAAAGSAGPTGAAGTAGSVAIGTVTTGQPGTQAQVTNSGTGTAAVLNFVIPQGATGAAGSGGSGGSAAGNSFAAMYHAVSYTGTYFSVNNPNASASETATVLAWIPNACTATQLSVYSQQSNTISVTLRAGYPGSMANTAIACAAATGGSCTSTGSVSVAAGSFLDLSITGSSGTSAGVWTSVSCQ